MLAVTAELLLRAFPMTNVLKRPYYNSQQLDDTIRKKKKDVLYTGDALEGRGQLKADEQLQTTVTLSKKFVLYLWGSYCIL